MEATQYIKQLASMSGIPADDENLTNLLANESLQQIDINDDLAGQINGKLLTIDSAKSNSDLNKHFKATILNGLDAETKSLMTQLELGDDVVGEIMGETNSFKRVPLLVNKVVELEKAKAGATKGDQTKLQEEIDKLNAQIVSGKDTYSQQLADNNAQWEARFLDNTMTTHLSNYNYALPTEKSVSLITAKSIVNNAINQKGLKVVNSDNGGLKLVTQEGNDYFENNIKVSITDFTDKVLAEAKLLKTNNGDGGQGSNPPAPATPPAGGTGYANEVERQIAEIEGN